MLSYFKLEPVVQENAFKEKIYGSTSHYGEGQRRITIAHLETSAQVS